MGAIGFATATLSVLIAACAPSKALIQTAIAQTQRAWTPTPQAAATTPPCTDKGWGDIALYLQIGIDIRSVETLRNMKAKISEVDIDACTEEARQLLLSAFAGEIAAGEIAEAVAVEGVQSASQRRSTAKSDAQERTAIAIQRAKILLSQRGFRLRYP